MNAAIHALQQHDIHLFQELRDRIHDLDPHAAHLLGELRHAILARRHVRSSRIARDDFDPREIAVGLRVVEELCECRHMRGIEADDACAQELRRILGECRNAKGQGDEDGEREVFHGVRKWSKTTAANLFFA
jgi:hypothetical protein